MTNNPIKETRVYSEHKPKGYHHIKVWNSENPKGKYSFSISFGGGVMSKCSLFEEDAPYQFGHFNTSDEAIEAARIVITTD